ncbi:MAG: Gfo/Idh/MocA family protein, partial [Phycisphaerales bacterium]
MADSERRGFTRRDFVRLAAAVPLAGSISGVSAAAERPSGIAGSAVAAEPEFFGAPTIAGKPLTGPIRVGVVGCGGRGTGAAVQALSADKDVILHAMGDVFADRLNSSLRGITGHFEEAGDEQGQSRIQVPAERRFVGFDSYQKVIDSGIDVVLLTGYPHFRPEHLRAAVAAGKHIFAEKPVAVDSPGIRSVLESASISREKGLACLVGFCWRYHEGMRGIFDRLNSADGGGIGRVVSVHTTYHTDTLTKRPRRPEWSDMEFQLRNWWHFAWASGDHIVEQAVHSIDRLAWAVGDRMPVRVTCLGGRAARSGPEHGNVFDHFAAVYEYAGGLRAYHTCRQIDGCPSDNTDYVHGTKGQAVINGWAPTLSIRDLSGKEFWKYT